MAAPVRINTIDTQDLVSDLGPKSLGGALYCLGTDPTSRIKVYKSTDSGATWVEQDTANSPLKATSSHTSEIGWDSLWFGTKVTVVYNKQGTTEYRIKTFETATDTWGSESVAGPLEQDANDRDQTVRILRDSATGDIYLFYTEQLTTFQTINYSVYNGVSFSAGIILVSASGTEFNYISSAVVDSNGDFRVFYRKCTVAGNTGKPYQISLTTGGVIGSENQIDSTNTAIAFGRASALTDTLILPAYNTSNIAGVWVGTPLSAPVWQFVLVDTNSLGVGVHDIGDLSAVSAGPTYGGRAFSFVDSGVCYLLWASTNGPTPNKVGGGYTVNAIYVAASNDGISWTSPTLVYDEFTNPGAWYGTLDPDISAISASIISGSLFSIANLNCEGRGFLESITPPVPGPCDTTVNVQMTVVQKKVRLQIYDDGIGEYVYDSPVSSITATGHMNPVGVNRQRGIFYAPAPLTISRGLATVQLTNIENTEASIRAHLCLVFAVPKKDRWEYIKADGEVDED